MSRPRLLDLFSGAGGAAAGYREAGFEVLGVDHVDQPRDPFRFVKGDALEYLASVQPEQFDLIHASPPCQAYSAATPAAARGRHPDLLAVVRRELQRIGTPWVIENVPGAPMLHPLLLCGTMFGLRVFRHRLFDTSHLLLAPFHTGHGAKRIGVNGFCTVAGGGNSGLRDRAGGRMIRCRPEDGVNGWRRAMGISWMSRDELAQAIPPAYTKFIGERFR
jgi:DNA (cytosine-5)-methyltransferase 1